MRLNSNVYKNIFNSTVFDTYNIQSQEITQYTKKFNVTQENHNLNLNDIIYFDKEDNLYKKALANEQKYEAIGIITNILNQDRFTITVFGVVNYQLDKESESSILYLSDSEEGKFCTYEEITTDFYVPIGIFTKDYILISIIDASSGSKMYNYENNIFESDLPKLQEQDITDIIQEVLNNV